MADKIKELEELLEMVSIAIAREKSSIAFYIDAYNKAITEDAKKIFSTMIEQERNHEAELRNQLQALKTEIESERLKRTKSNN